MVAAAGAEAVVWDLGFLAQQPRILNVLRGHTAPIRSVSQRSDEFCLPNGFDFALDGWVTVDGKRRRALHGFLALSSL